jgi:hypothetical protein
MARVACDSVCGSEVLLCFPFLRFPSAKTENGKIGKYRSAEGKTPAA